MYTMVPMLDAGFGNTHTSITQRRYLGSKTKLLAFIDEVLEREKAEYSSFADIFAGTGSVANFFHSRSHIIVNDILESNYQSYVAFFGKQRIREKWLSEKIKEFNTHDISALPENYFSENFANTYFDETNSKRIGYIREEIERLYVAEQINSRERAYLITSLLYAADKIANTVGHYDAYRKVEIPLRRLELKPLAIMGSQYSAKIYKMDANQLVRDIKADVVYIDPPYNSRQYSDAYHLLENIVEWKKAPVYGVAKKIDRSHLKSHYSLKSAASAFSDLINHIDAKYILVSYNDMGTSGDARSQSRISDHELISALECRGKVTVHEKEFGQFTTGRSTRGDLKERVFFCKVEKGRVPRVAVKPSEHNTHRPEVVKSPLNYTGGKYRLLPQLVKFWPKDIHTFYDIFCGGANVGINAKAKKVVCVDKNIRVIELLQLIQKSNFDELNQSILTIVEKYGLSQSYINGYGYYQALSTSGLGLYNKERYQRLRDDYNAMAEGVEKTVHLLVLILYGFNNQIRFNSKGQFNLPVGKRDYNGNSRRNLANFNAITNIKDITFAEGDFRDLAMLKLEKDDFVYLDPPYLLGLATYNESGGWSQVNEEELYRVLTEIHEKGVRFALSNVIEHKGETNTLLGQWAEVNGFSVHYLDYNYKNSSYQTTAKHNTTVEVLVTNYSL